MSRPPGARSAWISGKLTPARPGVYERQVKGLPVTLNRFDGERWFVGQPDVRSRSTVRSVYQAPTRGTGFRWRGLAGKPVAAAMKAPRR